MDRRGFLRGILGAATLPLIPVLGPISETKRTMVGRKAKALFDAGLFYAPYPPTWTVEEWHVPDGIIKIKAKLRTIPSGTYDCAMAS